MTQLSNQPPKGTSDWWPDEFAVRQYIFDTWRRVNRQFGYEEYMTPILETADIYRAKSGEDIGGKELMTMTDQAGRELAIRPEMTPSVTRMVSRFYKQAPKPMRLFSIANFWRNERPQRGRNREFWQLNTDIFGSASLNADLEILQIALEIMLAFHPPAGSFTMFVNHRQLIDAILSEAAGITAENRVATVRVLDKHAKLPPEKFTEMLREIGLGADSMTALKQFVSSETAVQLLDHFPQLAENEGYQQLTSLLDALEALGYGDWVVFNPSVIRGFDYYDGMVFEVFDNHPENNRSLFGGGRYNGLGGIFGAADLPAVGFAPGDEPTKLFLQSWQLVPERPLAIQMSYLPLLDDSLNDQVLQIGRQLRQAGINVEIGVEKQSFKQAFKYADNKDFDFILLIGSNEAEQGVVSLKNLTTGEQTQVAPAALAATLKGHDG